MIEVVWRCDAGRAATAPAPASGADARRLLDEGSERFRLMGQALLEGRDARQVIEVDSGDLGVLSGVGGVEPAHQPFAAILGCSDARVPVELVFGQGLNDLFVVRVAGNVAGTEAIGSLRYAVDHLATMRVLVVLGHSGCGAIAAAVDGYLRPAAYLDVAEHPPLRAIVDSLMIPVRGADRALADAHGAAIATAPGYPDAIASVAVALNAALTAAVMTRTLKARLGNDLDVLFGVYDLARRTVGVRDDGEAGLRSAPDDTVGFADLARRLARSPDVLAALERSS